MIIIKELNGKLGRLRKFDENAGRWEATRKGDGVCRTQKGG